MSERLDICIRHAMGDELVREWLIAVIGRGEIFNKTPPVGDPSWLGRRALALSILEDIERAQPGAQAFLIGEANERARDRDRRRGEGHHGIRGDEGDEIG